MLTTALRNRHKDVNRLFSGYGTTVQKKYLKESCHKEFLFVRNNIFTLAIVNVNGDWINNRIYFILNT